jgi:hypothetical protein
MTEGSSQDREMSPRELRALREEIRQLEAAIRYATTSFVRKDDRDLDQAEMVARRRGIVVLLLFGIVFAVFATDGHVAGCSPGARVARVFNSIQDGEQDQEKLERLYDHPPNQFICDVSIPWHSHTRSNWPTAGNWVGMAIYGLVFALMTYWWRVKHRVYRTLLAKSRR